MFCKLIGKTHMKHDSCAHILCLWSRGLVLFMEKLVFAFLHLRWLSVLFDSCGPAGNADCVGGFDEATSLSTDVTLSTVPVFKS